MIENSSGLANQYEFVFTTVTADPTDPANTTKNIVKHHTVTIDFISTATSNITVSKVNEVLAVATASGSVSSVGYEEQVTAAFERMTAVDSGFDADVPTTPVAPKELNNYISQDHPLYAPVGNVDLNSGVAFGSFFDFQFVGDADSNGIFENTIRFANPKDDTDTRRPAKILAVKSADGSPTDKPVEPKWFKSINQWVINEYQRLGKPLVDMNGRQIKVAGSYDFTMRGGGNKGASFEFWTNDDLKVTGKSGDSPYQDAQGNFWLKSMTIKVIDNEFGDNLPDSQGKIWDPGSGGTVDAGQTEALKGLVSATIAGGINVLSMNYEIPDYFKSLSGESKNSQSAVGAGLSPLDGSSNNPSTRSGAFDEAASPVVDRNGGEIAAMNLSQAVNQFTQNTGEGEGQADANARKGQGAQGQGAGTGGEAALGEDQSPKTQRKRGLVLQPIIDQLATASNEVKSGSSLLKNLSEGSIMGNNLLDALALGAGVLYALYAPKAVETGKKGLRGLINRVRNKGGAGAALPEQNLLSIFVMKLPNGTERLMATRVSMGGIEIIGQQDLPDEVSIDSVGVQTQIDFAVKQLIAKIGNPGADILLLGPKLKGQSALVRPLARETQLLNTQGISTTLSNCSATELEALQNWLNKPSSTPPESSPVYSQMMQRIASYATGLPAEQANMAGLIELSVALGWSERGKAA